MATQDQKNCTEGDWLTTSDQIRRILGIFEQCGTDGKIRGYTQWLDFMRKLCIHKIIRKEEISELNQKVLIYPIDFEHTIETLSNFSQKPSTNQHSVHRFLLRP
jgi:hypothetical protein